MNHGNALLWIKLSLLRNRPAAFMQQLAEDTDFISELPGFTEQELLAYGFTPHDSSLFLCADEAAEAVINTCEKQHISFSTPENTDYPVTLKRIDDMPAVIYTKGTLPDIENTLTIGVVGSRSATSFSLKFAENLGRDLAKWGITLVSGGASGIDEAVMRGAISADGTVIGVFGNGLDIDYPAKNGGLFRRITDSGALISEYAPGVKPEKWHFPFRNRIISGISHGIVVVEAPLKSGSLHTANYALEQGKDLFAVPGQAGAAFCAGSNRLLRDGAFFCEGIDDLISFYNSRYHLELIAVECNRSDAVETVPKKDKSTVPKDLSPAEQAVLAQISFETTQLDEIISGCKLTPGEVISTLTLLRIKLYVRSLPGGAYIRIK